VFIHNEILWNQGGKSVREWRSPVSIQLELLMT
jgi:hypothetical protein